jgi:hypothetical protein
VAVSNSLYRITLIATDSLNRKATNSVDVFPVAASTPNNEWASFYPFTTGANDASNRYNGTLLNGAAIVTDAVRGRVLELSGGSQHVNLPAGAGSAQTLCAWVKWNGGAAWQRVFDFGQDANRWLMLTPLDGEGRMQCGITTDLARFVQVIQTPAAFPVGVWTHVAVAFDARQGILYTNGRAVAVNNSVNLLPSDVAPTRCYFGRSQFAVDPYFNGRIDSAKLNSSGLAPEDLFAPIPVITQPAANATFAGGDTVSFAGSATDFTDTPLPAERFTWSAEFHHEAQTDPAFGPVTAVTNGTFQVSPLGPVSTNVFYRINLVAKDAEGRTAAVARDLLPRISWLTLETVPPGLTAEFEDQSLTTPAAIAAVAGFTRTVSVPTPQVLAGSNYDFVLWSDGGARTHAIKVPESNTTYVASLVAPTLVSRASGTNLVLAWPAWAAPMNLYATTNLAVPAGWQPVTNIASVSNQLRVLVLDNREPTRFFRLQSPSP